MNLDDPLRGSAASAAAIAFDVETTGTDPLNDQIIELSAVLTSTDALLSAGDAAGERVEKTWRIKPSVPISPAAQAVHGISLEDLADCGSFADYAREIQEFFLRAGVLVGYNLRFDLEFLQGEFRRHKMRELETSKLLLIDPYLIWRKCEPRSLGAAHLRFVGRELTGAHGALADSRACADVLGGMVEQFNLGGKSAAELAELCGPVLANNKNWIGPSYHFRWQDGVPVFGFGKHKGRPVIDVAAEDNGSYFVWVEGTDFPAHVKEIARRVPKSTLEELCQWLSATYGRA